MANMAQAIRMALHVGESQLGVKDIFGQDVGAPLGGVFTATQGLETAWNTPLDERGIIGMAMGIAMTGDRCVAEIQFVDYIFNTMDLLKMAGNTYWSTNGGCHLPLVVMSPVGAGIRGSLYHSHSFDAWASRLPGWKVVIPSTPLDAYGLMLSAIEDPNPVLYLNPKALMRVRGKELIPGEPTDEKMLKSMIDAPIGDRSQWKADWPKLEDFRVPIGKGKVTREGTDLTVVSYGRQLLMCNDVADKLRDENISVEVIDLRSIYPYDWQLIKSSVRKTRKVLFVNEDTEVTNFGEHLALRVTRELFYELWAAPAVLAAQNLPGIGLHPNLEESTVPQPHDIEREIRQLFKEQPQDFRVSKKTKQTESAPKKDFDKYYYYRKSVQSPDNDVLFFRRTYRELTGTFPKTLCEDFCGTFDICCEWVKLGPELEAMGIDLEPETLQYGKKNYLSKLSEQQQKRIKVVEGNVLDTNFGQSDIVVALNFSYFLFKKRSQLKAYFEAAYSRVKEGGIFIADCFGGSQCQEPNEEETEHDGFSYYWDQDSFDPVTNHAQFYIHFKVKGEKKRERCFEYDWRMWSIPEIREIMEEAGFKATHVYWEGTDEDGEGDGEFRRVTEGEECEAWVAYVVAEK